jgi:putative peptide zinc metalloprotease protein
VRTSSGSPRPRTVPRGRSRPRHPDEPRAQSSANVDLDFVPARAEGVELLGELQGSGYHDAQFLVRRGDGQTLQLSPILHHVLDAIDGQRSFAEIAATVSPVIGREADADDIRFVVEEKLRPLGVLRGHDGSEPSVKRLNPLLTLRFRRVLAKPETTQRITARFTPFFLPPVVWAMTIAFVLVSGWVLFEKGLGSPIRQALYEPGLLLLVFGLIIVSAAFHEIGHATACRYGGAEPGGIGVALYLMWPAFYTDVTDSYRLDRRGRLRVDLGGLYFNAIFAVGIFGLWSLTGWDALLIVIPLQIMQMLHQLLPFIRLDGYHILADLTGVPDLFARIKPTLLGMLPGRHARGEASPLKRSTRVVVTVWVLMVVPVLALSLVLIIVGLPRIAATAWDSLGLQWDALGNNVSKGDAGGIGVRFVSMLAIALPLLSISYLVTRVSRRSTRRVWRATEHRPRERALVVVVGLLLIALIAWAWTPRDQYRPIQPNERGTLISALESVVEGASDGGGSDSTVVVMPDGRVIADTRSAPNQLVVPEQDALPVTLPDGTFVPQRRFVPFNLPAPPGEGDNQALAYNTVDGSSIFELAYSLDWVVDGTVDNTNEAYALAHCVDCLTVVAAFQVVLILGQADVIVPQNIAVAVNTGCLECITTAIALQLVVTMTGPLTDEGMAQLDQIWDQLAALEEQMDELTPTEIYAELVEIETAILQVITEETTPSPAEEPAPAPTETPTTTTPDTVPDTTTTTTTAPEPTPTTEPAP